jgi:hypothetical protein
LKEQLEAALKNGLAVEESDSPPPALSPLISPHFSTNVEVPDVKHVSQFAHLERASPGIYDADSDIDEHEVPKLPALRTETPQTPSQASLSVIYYLITSLTYIGCR